MSLIKSISGIRGTIGGRPGDGLSPLDVVKFTAAYAKVHRCQYNPHIPNNCCRPRRAPFRTYGREAGGCYIVCHGF